MEGEIRVVSSDGLDLKTQTLNYLSDQGRIFTQSPVRYTLNNINGRADRASFMTETRLLELTGNVKATYHPEEETSSGDESEVAATDEPLADDSNSNENDDTQVSAQFETLPTDISCQKLLFDMENHSLLLEDGVRLSQTGSLLRARRIEAELTEDNRQFTKMTAYKTFSRSRQDADPEPAEEGDEQPTSLSRRASGIRSLEADTLTLLFSTDEGSSLQSVVAEGEASLELEPGEEQRKAGGEERKRLLADKIEGIFGSAGEGLKKLIANNEEGRSKIEVMPLKKRRTRSSEDNNGSEPKTILAETIDATVDPETGDFSTVLMIGDVEMQQGDTVVTGSAGKFDEVTDKLEISGKPELRDKGKKVTADQMVVTLGIGDLWAQGAVNSTFYPSENDAEADIFAIGEEAAETSIAGSSLRLDYRNNVLRYSGNVVALQGNNKITSQRLDIFQEEQRMIATETVKATLIFTKEESEGAAGEEEAAESEEEDQQEVAPGRRAARGANEENSQEPRTTVLRFEAGRMDFDKKHSVLLLVNSVKAHEGDMLISGRQLRYDIGGENQLKKAYAQGEVQVNIGPKIIYGDKAEYFVPEQVLVVQGKNVRLWESGTLEANHHKLTFDIANDTLRFDARADQLLKTRISNN